jgi:PAS domain S-box-containing protein
MGERVEFENDHGGPIDPEAIADERFAAIFQLVNNMQCGLLVLDRRGAIFGSNERLRAWLGYPGEGPLAIRGRMATTLVAPEMHERFESQRKRVDEGDLRATVTILRRRDGTTFPVLAIPHRFVREGWEEIAYFGILVDLATIQTAETGDDGPSRDVCSTLDRVAVELRAISLALSAASRVSVPVSHSALEELSDREMEVVVQLADGRRVPAIAKALYISPNTVRNHLKSVYRKLGVHSQTELLETIRRIGSDDAGNAPTS